jgi:hypothetical protein
VQFSLFKQKRKIQPMRVSLAALASEPLQRTFQVPVSVQVRPSRGMSGEHHYMTDSSTLRNMLKRQTDLSGPAIDRFMSDLRSASTARLSGVELNDRTLKEIGFFVD